MAENADDAGELAPGAAAGEHVLTGFIARGGGGAVYSARHATTGREAAVKILHRSLATLPKMVERFRREVQALNWLSHPSIVEILEVGSMPDGRPFFAMELLRGRTVSKLLEKEGRLPLDEALQIFEPVCEALAAAHAAGIVHRDVKTSNVMVDEGTPRRVKLLDFGVAKLIRPEPGAPALTSEGTQLGTATSMAPEQIRGDPVIDERADIYALGVLLYFLLTSRPPFFGSAPEIMNHHLYLSAPRPSARAPAAAPFDPIVLRCMEKEPAHRYGSVEALLAALRELTGSPRRSEAAAGIGAAIYVDVRLLVAPGSPDAARGEAEVGSVLDASEDALREEGVGVVSSTGNYLLAVRPLHERPAAATEQIRSLLRVAATLRQGLDHREQGLVHVNLCVHVAEILVRGASKAEIVGGPLTRVELWAPMDATPGVCVTRAAAERLGEASLLPGPGELLTLRGPFAGR